LTVDTNGVIGLTNKTTIEARVGATAIFAFVGFREDAAD
jgi:hypothetical protein